MANQEAQFEEVRTRLGNLRHLISGSDAARRYLALFDELLREYEFALALETLCDFLREVSSPIDPAVLVQIDDLHRLMKVEDTCIEKLWKLADDK
jgi:hypothetical protein